MDGSVYDGGMVESSMEVSLGWGEKVALRYFTATSAWVIMPVGWLASRVEYAASHEWSIDEAT